MFVTCIFKHHSVVHYILYPFTLFLNEILFLFLFIFLHRKHSHTSVSVGCNKELNVYHNQFDI